MGKKAFTFNGVEFDDIVNDIHGRWATICRHCVTKHKFDRTHIDECAAVDEICGVKGCSNVADYYIEFGKEDPPDTKPAAKLKHINIVTPTINISNNKHFNVLVSSSTENKVNSVSYNNSNSYVIITKDAVTPDIIIDEKAVDALIRARTRKLQMESVIEYCEMNTHIISPLILRDTRTLTAIVEAMPIDIKIDMDQIGHICETMPCVQRYLTT